MIRKDIIYVVVTVGRRANSYVLRKRRPKLRGDQFAYQLGTEIDTAEWLDRIKIITGPSRITPPKPPEPKETLIFGKTEGEKIRDRMAGRT